MMRLNELISGLQQQATLHGDIECDIWISTENHGPTNTGGGNSKVTHKPQLFLCPIRVPTMYILAIAGGY